MNQRIQYSNIATKAGRTSCTLNRESEFARIIVSRGQLTWDPSATGYYDVALDSEYFRELSRNEVLVFLDCNW